MLRVSSPTMFSWHGVIVPPEIENEYASVIDKLIFGPRRDLRYKKLKGYDNLIAVRANRKHRLLFTTVIHEGSPYLNFVGVMLKHKYSRVEEDVSAPTAMTATAFLQPGVLEHFRQANAPMLTEAQLTKEHFVAVDEEECGLPPVIPRREQRIGKTDFNKTKFIILNPDQQNIAEATVGSRVVIKGDAGSGKTCVIMAHLTRHAENHLLCDADLTNPDAIAVKPVVCVVKSAQLCAFLQNTWSLSPVGQRYTKAQVQFRIYNDLIRELDQNASKRTEVGRAEFESFVAEQIAAMNRQTKHQKDTKAFSQHFLTEVDYYQEIRIVAAVDNQQAYELLGVRQSQVNKKDRTLFYDICKKYLDYMHGSNLIDFSLYQADVKPVFSLVAADEAGDYTRREMNTLCKLSENNKVLLGYDQNQRLDDGKEQLEDYKAELNAKDGKMMPVIQLTHTYRCGKAIVDMANQVSQIRYKLTKRKLNPMTVAPSVMHAGHVEILTELDAAKLAELRVLASLPNCAVITTEENKKAAMAEFNIKEAHTAKEMKGLDRDVIVLYRLMERQSFYDANKALAKGENSEKFILDWNEYFTGCTRAVQRLYIVEMAKNKLKHILVELRKGLPAVAVAEKPKNYTEDEIQNILLRDLRKYAAGGDVKQARAVGADPRLKMTVEEVEKIIRAVAPAVAETSSISSTNKDIQAASSSKKSTPSAKAAPAAVSRSPAALFGVKSVTSEPPSTSKTFDPAAILKTEYTVAELESIAQTSESYKGLSVRINDLFIIPKAATYLFETPLLADGDNLFTLLLDNPVTRRLMLCMIFTRHFVKLIPHLSIAVLNRGKPVRSAPIKKMPPIFWICQSEVTLGLLQQNAEFDEFWKLENFSSLMTTVDSDCALKGTSGLHWLAVHHTSRPALAKLVSVGKLGRHIAGEQLLAKRRDQVFTTDIEFSIFDYLLSGGEEGIDILINIIDQQPDLAYQLKLEHLFPIPDVGEDKPPLLTSVIASKNGKRFLKKIQLKNPEFAPFLLTECTPQECYSLLRILKPVIRNVVAKHEYIMSLLRGIREKDLSKRKDLYGSLEVLLTDERSMRTWQHYLFNIAACGDKASECYGESLFFNLMHAADSRPVMIRLILKYQAIMRPYVSLFALSGIDKRCIDTPFAWMIQSSSLRKVLLNWLKKNTILAKMITTEYLMEQYHYEDYKQSGLLAAYEHDDFETLELIPGTNYSIYKILALSKVGREIISEILKSKINNASDTILYELTDDCFVDPVTNEKSSVLEYLTADASRIPLAFTLLRLSSVDATDAVPDEVICKGLHQRNLNKTPIIINLLKYENGFPLLLTFSKVGFHSRSQIADYLFSVFYTTTNENDEIVGLTESLMDNLIKSYMDTSMFACLLQTLLKRNPEIANNINIDLFDKPARFHTHDKEFRQQRIAQRLTSTKSGKELLELITGLRLSYSLRPKF